MFAPRCQVEEPEPFDFFSRLIDRFSCKVLPAFFVDGF